ncbi:hypothetical protein LX97_02692 [Nonlabens dokdonensis]|jgi:hypothetical protein|uniref:DUF6671 domain-containing protein n=2 Tax=Nonlabens dokdonensis TaxID=328515 RepID=L7W9K2_NONDD|nr:DUF6671 family protein [Nonlabens dokdonensis]AGC78360.1 hypothetical protein DDD_3233 [Nonlabens dokdonensis DSW-6]PZX38112.1 hypothetical protein LX97_02692 [Nonlabens dokdonensis]
MFQGRKLVIATKHRKEEVIAPLLEEALQVKCFVNEGFDTDILGTFSGEVERKEDPISTARQKCLMAMEASDCDLGIASEGSFGAHPSAFFASADDEFLIFIDKKNNLEIVARELSMETNFNGQEITSLKELIEFAKEAQFPSHALILRRSKDDTTDIIKGITNDVQLQEAFEQLSTISNKVYVETDMRAMHNPSRMKVIEAATKKIIKKIQTACPKCNMPGFDITEIKKGLPCDLCSQPTNSILSHLSMCKHCSFTKEEFYPNDKQTEDPMYCDFCNP